MSGHDLLQIDDRKHIASVTPERSLAAIADDSTSGHTAFLCVQSTTSKVCAAISTGLVRVIAASGHQLTVTTHTMSDQQTFNADNGYHVFTAAELAVMEQIKQRMKGANRQSIYKSA